MMFKDISAGAPCVFVDRSLHGGEILGKDDSDGEECVWALIYDRKVVFQFHPSDAAVDCNGAIVFRGFEREKSVEDVLAQRPGDGTSPIFGYASDPESMLRQVKMIALLLP